MNSKKNLIVRLVVYLGGLFIMTLGIAISVKSNLGVSPVSSIPYTLTCVIGMEMGNATILLHIALVILQIILLRKKFKWKNLLQVIVGIIFGKFTTLCNSLMGFLPTPDNMIIRIFMILISAFLIALGIFFYMPADIMPLAGEGATQAISQTLHKEFARVKVGFDISMVVISLITCLIAIHSFGSVGIGTVIAACIVGVILGFLNKKIGYWRDTVILHRTKE